MIITILHPLSDLLGTISYHQWCVDTHSCFTYSATPGFFLAAHQVCVISTVVPKSMLASANQIAASAWTDTAFAHPRGNDQRADRIYTLLLKCWHRVYWSSWWAAQTQRRGGGMRRKQRIKERRGVALICWLIPSAVTFNRKVTLRRLNSVSDSVTTSIVMICTHARVQSAVKSWVRGVKNTLKWLRSLIEHKRIKHSTEGCF